MNEKRTILKATLKLGKIYYTNKSKPTNDVEIDIRYEYDTPNERATIAQLHDAKYKNGTLSITGEIWRSNRSDIECGGQCLDEIRRYSRAFTPENRKLFLTVYRLWRTYHLNDMNAGTPEQTALLETSDFRLFQKDRNIPDWYDAACTYLKTLDMYIVPAEQADPYRKYDSTKGKPYTFGFEWLYYPIPNADVDLIISIIENAKEKPV